MHNIRYLAVLSVLICFLAAPVHAAQMSVEPAYQQVFNGDEITVNITVDPEESGAYTASYTLHFNNTLLNATSQTKGPFLTQDGADSDVWRNVIDNNLGKIEYSESRKGDVGDVTDSGVLTTITFEVIGDEGTSTLNLSKYANALLWNTSGPVPTDLNNGSVEVKKGIYGDCDQYPGVTTNDGWLIYMNLTFPGDPEYAFTNAWAADCDIYSGVTTNDGWLIYMNLTFPGDPEYALGC